MNRNTAKHIYIAEIVGILLFSSSLIFAQSNQVSQGQVQNKTPQQQNQQASVSGTSQISLDLRKKINQINNPPQREMATKIALQLGRINQVSTDNSTNVLNKLNAVLQKIKSRRDKALVNGKDVSLINTAIQRAEIVISLARKAVLQQAKKTYVVDTKDISTESSQNVLVSKLRIQFHLVRDQLFDDINFLRFGVVNDARTTVQDVLRILSGIPDVDKEPGAK